VFTPPGHRQGRGADPHSPFAAALSAIAADVPGEHTEGSHHRGKHMHAAGTVLVSLGAAGVQQRPETVFAVSALALLTLPGSYTLHLGEVNPIVAAFAAADLLRHRHGSW
jgi:hypothetical protein